MTIIRGIVHSLILGNRQKLLMIPSKLYTLTIILLNIDANASTVFPIHAAHPALGNQLVLNGFVTQTAGAREVPLLDQDQVKG